jgi:hypothetical protein
MRTQTLLPVLLALAGCRGSDPSWANLGTGTSGDSTVAGAPAPVHRAAAIPVIDGKLDDPAWSNAAVLGPFVSPSNGAAAPHHPVAASARVMWDDQRLYIGAVVRDRAASSPFASSDPDPHIWAKASAIEVMLQPGDPADNRDYYELQVDVAGALFDTHWDDYNVPIRGEGDAKVFGHVDWSSQTQRAVHVARGSFYAVEMAVPWSSLTRGRTPIPPRAGDVWRLNLYSFRDGQAAALAWSPIRGQGNFHKSARFGRIQFD